MTRSAIYPGCSLEGTGRAYLISLRAALNAMGGEIEEMEDWNCCGATSAHALNPELQTGLGVRNLAIAEKQGIDEILAPCAACYHRLASVNGELARDEALPARAADDPDLVYSGNVKIRNILDLLANVVGSDEITRHVVKPLSGLKVACYYGCLNTRIPRQKSFDDMAYPQTMDRVVEALGAMPLDWGYRTECCGASLFVGAEETALRLVGKILKDAALRGADCVVVACPMCHNNLDAKQAVVREAQGIDRPLPILFISQLMGLAFGLSPSELKMQDAFVPFGDLEVARR